MANFREILRDKLVPVSFERTIGMFGATTIGVGALMGAGVYVLIGMAADAAGPSVWMSYMICGGLAFLTTLLYAELARLVPTSGGGYAYAYDALGSFGGFITGWFLALGSVFACGLYAVGFAEYFVTFINPDIDRWVVVAVAVGLVLLSTLVNSLGAGGDRLQMVLTWGNLLILLVLVLFAAPKAEAHRLEPLFPNGFGGTLGAISIIYISFFGYQMVANNTDEIIRPKQTVPRSMVYSMLISFVVYLAIALVAITVIDWRSLAASKAPLVMLANASFGSQGWLLISTGGVLAAAGALNSTLLSQGRQLYAMGKNRFVPDFVGKIHPTRKTPMAAIAVGGGLVVLVVLGLELEFIAKSANFCLLASLLPVSLALRKVYRSKPENRPKARWKLVLPELTLLANLSLLLTLDWLSLAFGMQLGLLGLALYFFYSRKREKRSQFGLHIVLDQHTKGFLSRGSRILMPTANPNTQKALFNLSNALLERDGGEIVSLSVVLAPRQTDFATALARLSEVPIVPVIRAAHSLHKGIVDAAEEESCDLIVMGYAGSASEFSRDLAQKVIHLAPTDVIFLKLLSTIDEFAPRRVAVSMGGRVNLELMVKVGAALADRFGGELTFLSVLPTQYSPEQKAYADRNVMEAIELNKSAGLYNVRLLASDQPLDTLVRLSAEFDLLIIGTTKVGLLQRGTLGDFATSLADRAACSVAIVRAVSNAKKIISKI